MSSSFPSPSMRFLEKFLFLWGSLLNSLIVRLRDTNVSLEDLYLCQACYSIGLKLSVQLKMNYHSLSSCLYLSSGSAVIIGVGNHSWLLLIFKNNSCCQAWWYTPVEAEAGGWISVFEACLVYRVSSRATRATQRKPTLSCPPPKKKVA